MTNVQAPEETYDSLLDKVVTLFVHELKATIEPGPSQGANLAKAFENLTDFITNILLSVAAIPSLNGPALSFDEKLLNKLIAHISAQARQYIKISQTAPFAWHSLTDIDGTSQPPMEEPQ